MAHPLRASHCYADDVRTLRLVPLALFAGVNVAATVAMLPLPLDYASFWASGAAASAGLDPYAVCPLTNRSPDGQHAFVNLNPPILLPLFQAFALLEVGSGRLLWFALSLLLYGAAVLLLARAEPGTTPTLVAWALSLAPFWAGLALGQIYAALTLGTVGAWLLLRRGRDRAGGLLLGLLVASRPFFALWPALLLLSGQRRPALWAGASALGLTGLGALLYGPTTTLRWLETLAGPSTRPWLGWPLNVSLVGLAERLGLPALGLPLAALLVGGLLVWAVRARPDREQAGALALVGMLLAAPISWVYYVAFLLPAVWRRSLWHPGLLLLLVPAGLVQSGGGVMPPVVSGSIYPLALLALLTSWLPVLWRGFRGSTADQASAGAASAVPGPIRPY